MFQIIPDREFDLIFPVVNADCAVICATLDIAKNTLQRENGRKLSLTADDPALSFLSDINAIIVDIDRGSDPNLLIGRNLAANALPTVDCPVALVFLQPIG